MTINLTDYLESLGYDASANYVVPEDPAQASLDSINAFVEASSGRAARSESVGIFHITGPSVSGCAAPLKTVGKIMTSIQDSIDALGASIGGFTSISGQIPLRISGRTEMSLTASPMPGSIILQVAPSMSRQDDLCPNGPSLFDPEEKLGISPLADQAFSEFSALLQELSEEGPDKTAFVDHLTELGPRAANKMKDLCKTIDSTAVDVDFKWSEPGKDRVVSAINHLSAKHAVAIIENAHIENEAVNVVGTIVTITESAKDKLRIRTDEGGEITLALGSISPADLLSVRVGDRVEVQAEQTVSSRTGGRTSKRLEGVSISKIRALQ
ncbi:hypothetical protein [Ellagibacter sp.]|uniref:hypothetical protein n=1 Tax=Ellagibacter sp. TaxID=2137578 RepID=UPI003AB910EA